MSSTGLSIMLTVALVTIASIQLLKDNFTMIENFGEVDGVPSSSNNDFNAPSNDSFSPPLITTDASANGYWATPTAYQVYMSNLNAATPNETSLETIGSETYGLPGPGQFNAQVYSPANVSTGRAANLSLCAQNMSTFATGTNNGAISSSLLPMPVLEGDKMGGFNDCPIENVLANQTFLSRQAGGQIGTDTISGSLRNANLDLRSDPPNPMRYVGPWNLSTIYPDLTRRPLEGDSSGPGVYGNGPNNVMNPSPIHS